jgi:hypothetical protein
MLLRLEIKPVIVADSVFQSCGSLLLSKRSYDVNSPQNLISRLKFEIHGRMDGRDLACEI